MFFNCVQTDTEDLFCVYLARCRSVSGSFSITPGSLCESSVCVSGGAVSLFLSASSLLSRSEIRGRTNIHAHSPAIPYEKPYPP